MEYIIENRQLRAVISDVGGELISLRTKSDGGEFIWQGAEGLWDSHAPNLFPVCGRVCGLKYLHNGKTYSMGLHGFLHSAVMTRTASSPASVSLTLEANEETLSVYPFDFSLTLTHSLYGSTLRTRVTVENRGVETMPFSYGGHPGFNVPLPGENADFSDYFIEFADICAPRQMGISPNGYQTGEFTPYPLKDGRILPVSHDLFVTEGLFLTDTCRKLTLRSAAGSRSVSLRFPDMPTLGLWHDTGTEAPYLCVEPWAGSPDTEGTECVIDRKADTFRLAPGQQLTTGFDITVR